jgi:ribosomal protein S18 acetylase RimI-like enzyme
MTEQIPQLRMGFTRFDDLPTPRVPDGYAIRTFRDGDDDGWLSVLGTGGWDAWDRDRLDAMLAVGPAHMPRDGIVFATRDERIVGAACLALHGGDTMAAAEIGWVVVDTAHRGRGIARAIVTAMLGLIRERGYRYAFLRTEPFRGPAIKLYLDLGFQPEMVDARHPAWWRAFREEVGL